jgi:hypothetical protein
VEFIASSFETHRCAMLPGDEEECGEASKELVIARSEATKQSILSFGGKMDCFAEFIIGRRLRADPVARNDDFNYSE